MTETMQPEDVPDALADAGVDAWPDFRDDAGRPNIEDYVRHILAEVLPDHEDMIRAKVSAEILQERDNLPNITIDDRIFRTAMVLASRVAKVGPTRAPQATGDAHSPGREHGKGRATARRHRGAQRLRKAKGEPPPNSQETNDWRGNQGPVC